MPVQAHVVEIILPEGLVEDDGHGIGQVQGADVADHGDPHGALLIFQEDFLRDAGALFSEHDIAVRLVGDVGVDLGAFRGGHIDLGPGVFLQEILIVDVGGHIEVLPVVHAGPPEVLLSEAKAQGFDEVKSRARGHAGTADISRIGGNFWLQKYNI